MKRDSNFLCSNDVTVYVPFFGAVLSKNIDTFCSFLSPPFKKEYDDLDRGYHRHHQSDRRDRAYHDPRDEDNLRMSARFDRDDNREGGREHHRDYHDSRDGRNGRDGGRGGGGGGDYSHSRYEGRHEDRHEDRRYAGKRRDDYHGREEDDTDLKRRRMSEDRDARHHHSRPPSSDEEDGNSRRRRSQLKNKKIDWPSAFEDSGGSYVFDARSGLFYEAVSNYFYDPKNKLYYSNEKKIYYRHFPENESSGGNIWEEVKHEEGTMGSVNVGSTGGNGDEAADERIASQDLVLQALQGSNNSGVKGNKQERKKINICIKKKFTTSSTTKKKLSAIETDHNKNTTEEKQSRAQKARHANIEKWSQRVEEKVVIDEIVDEIPTHRIRLTKVGKPICW